MKWIFAATLSLGALLSASAAHATSVNTSTQTITFGPGPTDFTNSSQNLALFDSTLGTLQSVTISASYGFTTTITATATTDSSGGANTESAGGFTSSNSGISAALISTLSESLASIGTKNLAEAAFDFKTVPNQTYTLNSGNSYTQTFSNVDAGTKHITNATDTNSGDLAAFAASGGGTFAVLFNTLTGTNNSSTGGNASLSQTTTSTGTISLFYTYDNTPPAVPEPASLMLLGVGVVGMGLVRRIRR